VDFGAESALPLLAEHPNLLVVRTLSKSSSLAGLRVGYAMGGRELIEGLERVKSSINSYTVDRLAMAGAVAAIEDIDHLGRNVAKICATRERVSRELRSLGFSVADSKANFLFIGHEGYRASELYSRLKERKVLVRYWDKARIANRLRVSVGTDEEMELFLKALREVAG